jgi:hypothetical protein
MVSILFYNFLKFFLATPIAWDISAADYLGKTHAPFVISISSFACHTEADQRGLADVICLPFTVERERHVQR